ncbi:MAG TPA: PASTA domain-containing protein, partial [Acidobacteriaceae bacterium]
RGGGDTYYGGAASAPVFSQVAQETLQYLNVPHDMDVLPPGAKKKKLTVHDQEPVQEETADVNAMAAAIRDLPADDPLRESMANAHAAQEQQKTVAKADSAKTVNKPDQHESGKHKPEKQEQAQAVVEQPAPQIVTVAMPGVKIVKAPSLVGMPVRQAVEQAALLGLTLNIEGRGLVRSQEPAAGAQVQPGGQLTVHCAR